MVAKVMLVVEIVLSNGDVNDRGDGDSSDVANITVMVGVMRVALMMILVMRIAVIVMGGMAN